MKRWAIPVIFIFLSGLILWDPFIPNTAEAQTYGPDKPTYLPLALKGYDRSWQWGDTQIVTLSPTPFDPPLMAIDHDGRVHIFWDVSPSSSAAFIYHRYQTDTGWSAPAKIADTLGMSFLLSQPLITSDGRIHLLWFNQLAYGGPYRYMVANFDGSQWSPEEELARFPYDDRFGILNIDDQDNPIVVYGFTDLIIPSYFRRVHTTAGWSPAVDITPPMVNGFVDWNVWPDSLGGVRFLGRDLYSNIVYSYWKDGSFQTSLQLLPAVTWTDSSVLDSQNNLHLFRVASVPIPGGSVTGLYHQCLDTNLNWGPEQVLTGGNPIGDNYAISWDNSGRVIFTWKIFNHADFAMSLVTGCSQPAAKAGNFTVPAPTIHWGHLAATALSNQPGKFCALSGVQSQSQNYGLVCADILP